MWPHVAIGVKPFLLTMTIGSVFCRVSRLVAKGSKAQLAKDKD
jgi:hypothetical protein